MDAELWKRVREIFGQALEQDPSGRDDYLEAACAGDPTLLREVRSLLEASSGAEAFLGGLAARAGLTLEPEDRTEADVAGTRFGPYRIVRLLGRGGMGAVYVAERDDEQFHMEVALKAVPGTFLTPEARARFLSERQILAGLHHPNIAQLLDGGVSEDGVPYFVMEYVDGRRIDDYCREERLGATERLRLFLQVCRGVQHAHENLVVHRDLKPANILVTADGVVKLLDFGIARMLESEEGLYQTALHAPHPMTLAYASPEQVLGEHPTTACDVYGLGVLLYRLLTDTHPYDFEPGSTYPKVQQVICERTPTAPSAALDPRAAADRRVSRDLDAVTLKALAKEPAQRYPTVSEFAADLERYLEGRPVRARPPTPAYRLRRFVGRNRAVVGFGAAAAILAISLLGLGIRYAVDTRKQAEALAQEVQTTQAVSDFLVGLFSAADPSQGGSDTISAGTLLARGAERAGTELQDVPLVRARVLQTLSGVYWGLGMPWIADSLGYEGLLVRRAELGPAHPETLDGALRLAGLNREMQNEQSLERAESLFQEILVVTRGVPALRRQEAEAEVGLARVFLVQRDPERALPHLRSGIARAREVLDPGDPALLSMRQYLGMAFRDLEMPDSALAIFQEVLEGLEPPGGPAAPAAGSLRTSMAILLRRQGRLEEAEAQYRVILERYRHAMGRSDVVTVYMNLASVLREREAWSDLVSTLEETVAYAEEHWPPEHWQVGRAYSLLGQGLAFAGQPERGEALLGRALANYSAGLGPSHRWTANLRARIGNLYMSQGRYREAEAALTRAVADLRAAGGTDDPDLRQAEESLQELRRRASSGPS